MKHAPVGSTLWSVLLLAGLAAAPAIAADHTPLPAVTIDPTPVASKTLNVASYADALEAARPAVVSVYSTKLAHQRGATGISPGDFGRFSSPGAGQTEPERGLGSGVIVSADGYILTNNHVVEGADELLVQLCEGRECKARFVGADPKTDVAVIKIEGSSLPAITVADSDKLRVGDVVFALGNPLGVGQTATMGIVSATSRRSLDLLARGDADPGYEDFIQTDAAINIGNSGGALVDARGRLVGINTAIITTSRGNIGIGFSIPANLAMFVMKSLIESGTVVRGYLGVSTQDLDPGLATNLDLKDTKGVLISEVTPGGPAALAGLKGGDVVVAIDDKPVGNRDELRLWVSQMKPGSKISLRVARDGKILVLAATLAQLTEAPAVPGEWIPGIQVAALSEQVRREYGLEDEAKGVAVVRVERGSRFANRLVVGAVIEQVNRIAVSDARSAKEALRPGRNLLVVRSAGLRQFLSIELP